METKFKCRNCNDGRKLPKKFVRSFIGEDGTYVEFTLYRKFKEEIYQIQEPMLVVNPIEKDRNFVQIGDFNLAYCLSSSVEKKLNQEETIKLLKKKIRALKKEIKV